VSLRAPGEGHHNRGHQRELDLHPPINARPERRRQATWIARAAALTSIAALAAACSCSGDDGGDGDGDAAVDGIDEPLELETQVTDIATNAPLFDAAVTEVGTDNSVASAPNGRAVLQLTGSAGVLHELDTYLSNRMEVAADALAAHVAARQPQLSELARTADLDDIYAGLGLVRDNATTQVLVYVRQGGDFSPAVGVSIDAGGLQTLVRRAGTPPNFETGDAVVDDALVVIANAPGASLSITPSATCIGATQVTLAPGELASTFLVCD
jgi:hypothetical protein